MLRRNFLAALALVPLLKNNLFAGKTDTVSKIRNHLDQLESLKHDPNKIIVDYSGGENEYFYELQMPLHSEENPSWAENIELYDSYDLVEEKLKLEELFFTTTHSSDQNHYYFKTLKRIPLLGTITGYVHYRDQDDNEHKVFFVADNKDEFSLFRSDWDYPRIAGGFKNNRLRLDLPDKFKLISVEVQYETKRKDRSYQY